MGQPDSNFTPGKKIDYGRTSSFCRRNRLDRGTQESVKPLLDRSRMPAGRWSLKPHAFMATASTRRADGAA